MHGATIKEISNEVTVFKTALGFDDLKLKIISKR